MLLFLTDSHSFDEPPLSTPFGPAGWLRECWLYRAPGADPRAVIYAAKAQGASHLASVEEVIALNRLLRVGDWLVPDDYIEQTKGQPTTFFESRGMGYLQQSPAFSEPLRAALISVLASMVGPRHFEVGSYLAINSLRRLTPAEARAARFWGADLVGCVALPEATLAKELEMGYAILAHVATTVPATPAAPLPDWQPAPGDESARLVEQVDSRDLPSLEGSNSMARRLVGDDWREWIG